MSLKINIKTSTEAKFAVSVDPEFTIAQVKAAVEKELESSAIPTPAANQRLIFAGKVLKDEDTVASYKMTDGSTIHLVRSGLKPAAKPAADTAASATTAPAASTASATSPAAGAAGTPSATPTNPSADPLAALFGGGAAAGLGGLGGMGAGADPAMAEALLSNPAMTAAMSQMLANPQFMDAMIAANPQMSSMITPQMRAMMQSDGFRRMMANPEMVRSMMRMAPIMGGGVNPFAAGLGGNNTAGGSAPGITNAGMNPTGAGAFDPALLSMLMGGGAGGAFGGAALPPPPANPEEAYQEQLRQLVEMGFYDASENIRALTATRGNVNAAIEWLLNNPPGR